jgi:hypothetical protein
MLNNTSRPKHGVQTIDLNFLTMKSGAKQKKIATCCTSCLTLASCMGSNPVRGKPLFYLCKKLSLLSVGLFFQEQIQGWSLSL